MLLPELWAHCKGQLHTIFSWRTCSEKQRMLIGLRMMPQIHPTLHPYHTSQLREGNKLSLAQKMLAMYLGDCREVDWPQNPLAEGKWGITSHTLPTLATFPVNLEKNSKDTLLPIACSTKHHWSHCRCVQNQPRTTADHWQGNP